MQRIIGKSHGGRFRAHLLAASSAAGLASFSTADLACAQSRQTGAQAEAAATVGEVVVTAGRREATLTKLPFNISAYGSEQINRSNITSITALSQEVPNFVIQDQGARAAASSIPIIRGLNASQPVVTAARFFQSPVGFYLDNTPLTGYFPLDDLQRVEVLRGPQGTLYGAGALSGAVRVVPNDPQLDKYAGLLSASTADVSHSHHLDYDIDAMANIPIGTDAALRVAFKEEYDAGFISQNNIMKRANNNYVQGAPLLADPSDVAGSPAEYFNARDVNYTQTTALRASFLWQPNDKFQMKLAYDYADTIGDGGPFDNYSYGGGPSPIDPRVTLAGTGQYQISASTLEPYSRISHLASVDASYDVGFATLATTLAYGYTHANAETDGTVGLLGTPYAYYYTGTPADPRTVIPVTNPDSERRYTEELRLVSKEGGPIDYIVGLYFEQDTRFIGVDVWDPGADVQSAAANGGSTLPIIQGGTYVPLYGNNASYLQSAYQDFHDYSVYGDLTWHITDRWQVTVGTRVFYQTFAQSLNENSSFFEYNINQQDSNTLTGKIFKVNTSYKLATHTEAYFTWSQGFRRGGANSFVIEGPVEEPTSLLTYKPDTTDNYEIGLKGTWRGLYYSGDVFYIDWSNPQIDLLTPYNLTSVVVNAKAATSKGFEVELSGPIPYGPHGLSFSLGLAYAQARLSQDFGLPAGSGVGTIIQDAIVGKSGDRLPGAPDFSGSLNASYQLDLEPGPLTFSLGADYRSSIINVLPSINPNTPATTTPGYAIMHGSITFEHKDWEFELFSTNLTDSHIVLATSLRTLASYDTVGSWGNSYAIARPREVGIKLTKRF